MNKKLRYRILTKLAQTTPTPATTETAVVVPAPPAVPSILFANMNQGYNPATVALLFQIAQQLNLAVHYASQGKENFQSYLNDNFNGGTTNAASVDTKHLRSLSKTFYNTFLNGRNNFGKMVDPSTISNWCTAFTNGQDFTALSQINPTGQLAQKLPQNLKSGLQDLINQVRAQNPAGQ